MRVDGVARAERSAVLVRHSTDSLGLARSAQTKGGMGRWSAIAMRVQDVPRSQPPSSLSRGPLRACRSGFPTLAYAPETDRMMSPARSHRLSVEERLARGETTRM